MTKTEAVHQFKEAFLDCNDRITLRAWLDDKPRMAEDWNSWTDELCKDGEITAEQYETWSHPNWELEVSR